MKVLVIGDYIEDLYEFHKAARICPEAPVPVLVFDTARTSPGGAGLVAEQLKTLLGEPNAILRFGSGSIKKRIFADGHLVCRVDSDSTWVADIRELERTVIKTLKTEKPEIVIASDYGKGTFTEGFANRLVKACNILDLKLFVDAKNHWSWYRGAFAFFPNEKEVLGFKPTKKENVIQKLGARGCSVNGLLVATHERQARDTTGAGDIFVAAFAAEYLRTKSLIDAAVFANLLAGESVEYVGTKIIGGKLDGGVSTTNQNV